MSELFDRRECLRRGAAGLFAGRGPGAGVLKASPEDKSKTESLKPVRVGVVGLGPRGAWLLESLASNYPG